MHWILLYVGLVVLPAWVRYLWPYWCKALREVTNEEGGGSADQGVIQILLVLAFVMSPLVLKGSYFAVECQDPTIWHGADKHPGQVNAGTLVRSAVDMTLNRGSTFRNTRTNTVVHLNNGKMHVWGDRGPITGYVPRPNQINSQVNRGILEPTNVNWVTKGKALVGATGVAVKTALPGGVDVLVMPVSGVQRLCPYGAMQCVQDWQQRQPG